MKIVKVNRADDWATRKKWLDSLYKISRQIEIAINKMPDGLSNTEKLEAQLDLNQMERRIDMVRDKIRQIKTLEKSI